MSIQDYVNDLPPGARLNSLAPLLAQEQSECPIDDFDKRSREIIAYGTESVLNSNDFIGRLLVLGLVAAAESYFRGIMSATMQICPIAKSGASDKTINLGGLLWHGQQNYSRSVFDNSSFAGATELKKAAKDFLGFLLDDATFKTALDEFDKVCHLRHGIVHSDGILPGKNAVKLDIPRYSRPVRIVIRYQHLQEIALVINTLVVLFNRQLFNELCKRWAIDWRKRADWVSEEEEAIFAQIWSISHSKREWGRRHGRTAINRKRCLDLVRTTYNL